MSDELEYLWLNLGHELRSPIQNMIQLAQRALHIASITSNNSSYDKEIQKLNKLLVKQTNNLKILLDSIVSLGTTNRNELIYNIQPGNISGTLMDCISAVKSQEKAKEFDFVIHESIHNIPEFNYDHIWIERVLFNLLENAMKYSYRIIEDRRIEIKISAQKQVNHNIIKIDNWGVGIPNQLTNKVFDKYYRINHHHDRLVAGLGIGLTICKIVALAHDGDICINSYPTLDDPLRTENYEGYRTTVTLMLSSLIPKGQKLVKTEENNEKNVDS